MTAQETEQLLTNIIAGLDTASMFAGVIDPKLIPLIAIGQAVDKQIPGLAAAVQNWIEGNNPTDAEKADTAAKLAVLGDPNNP